MSKAHVYHLFRNQNEMDPIINSFTYILIYTHLSILCRLDKFNFLRLCFADSFIDEFESDLNVPLLYLLEIPKHWKTYFYLLQWFNS